MVALQHSAQVLDVRPDKRAETDSLMEQSTQSRNNIYALERDLYHGQFCYDNDYQFTFEVSTTTGLVTR